MLAFSLTQAPVLFIADLHFAASGQTIEVKLWFTRGFNGDSSCPKP